MQQNILCAACRDSTNRMEWHGMKLRQRSRFTAAQRILQILLRIGSSFSLSYFFYWINAATVVATVASHLIALHLRCTIRPYVYNILDTRLLLKQKIVTICFVKQTKTIYQNFSSNLLLLLVGCYIFNCLDSKIEDHSIPINTQTHDSLESWSYFVVYNTHYRYYIISAFRWNKEKQRN